MSMFCFQCQETMQNKGCTVTGICGKKPDTAIMQDLLIYVTKCLSEVTTKIRANGKSVDKNVNHIITENLFTTITNANFNTDNLRSRVIKTLDVKKQLIDDNTDLKLSEHGLWDERDPSAMDSKASLVGVLSTTDEDKRSLKELITYGIKGLSAYTHHANVLLEDNEDLDIFLQEALSKTIDESMSVEDLISLTLKTGEAGVGAMALLDNANTKYYGNPEITKVNIGVGNRPGILVSGHDLKDLEMLLEQSEGSGIDIYTHSEMLPANAYPKFKKYAHLHGNYGNAWWKQKEEFESFNGPILMTTNCIVPPKDSYKDRIFTTGMVSYPGLKHIEGAIGEPKDFTEIIELAKTCQPPAEIETGEIINGFAHNQVFELADSVVDAVKSGAIRKFIVMSGCDGRHKTRNYYTDFAENLPKDIVILTSGCAKYRYNKLKLGDINGIPRVLDAGQCNDSYSWAIVALKLKEIFNAADINDLPIEFNIAWYEQKAVTVLLALLFLGIKNIHLGPTLPAFLSPNVVDVLVEKFGISGIQDVEKDLITLG
ncbi:MAG: hydroxylamine reductase [Tissierellia bacterium]|nr:hydroxylamine reductase [Tissierellia bacterium]